MRSRYSAYAKGEIDYIISTHEVKEDDIDRAATEEWSKKAEWKGLEIRATEAGGESDAEGMVEFVAKYRQEGKDLTHHERSRFRKTDGQWKYVEGAQVKPAPVKAAPKTGRNEPCPCGSGKKYKKCHGGAEA
jgi:SEC-C motif-containing protein